jgi:hypothetical protein
MLNSKLLETQAVYIGLVGGVGNSKSYFKYTTNKNEILEVPIASKKNITLEIQFGFHILFQIQL